MAVARGVSVVVAVLLAVSACGGSGGTDAAGPDTTAPSVRAPSSEEPSVDASSTDAPSTSAGDPVVSPPLRVRGTEVKYEGEASIAGQSEVEIDAGDFFFSPTVLVGEPGQEVSVTVTNSGTVEHTFTIDEQDVDLVVPAGESAATTVTLPEQGEQLEFICRYHVAGGQAGLFAVQ